MNKQINRMTQQRKVILDELNRLKTHPTADELYTLVREKLPRISLGTVYRNLDVLAKAGMIRKLDMGGSQRRYDGIEDPHDHIRCLECGKVEDIHVQTVVDMERITGEISGYQIQGHRLEFVGLCPDCGPKENQ
ncbi:transcriptional repressor [bacterium]|nr:MAG: transcriptional repressor [bacterium]